MTLKYYLGGKIVGLSDAGGDTKPTNVPVNTTFIESDTFKEFIFDGVDTWNEITFKIVPFSPADISNLYAWYDASDLSTITKDGSDLVERWNNKEGTIERDLLETDGGIKPTWLEADRNGLDVINFASQKFMNTASGLTAINQPITVFLAALHPDDYTDFRTAYAQRVGIANTHRLMYGCIETNDTWRMNAGTTITTLDATIGGAWHYVSSMFNTSSSVTRVDGSQRISGNAGSNDYQGVGMGHNGGENQDAWSEKIGEVIFYDKLLNATEIDQVESYLANKWGI